MKQFNLSLVFTLFVQFCFGQVDYLAKAQNLYNQEKFVEALNVLSINDVDELEGVFLRGKAWYQLEEYGKSIDAFEACVDENNRHAEFHYWLGAANIEALQSDDNFFKKGIYAFDAQSSLKEALQLQPSHVEARLRLANYYLNAPMVAGGSVSDAEEQAEILKTYDHVQGTFLLALIYLKNEEYEKAENSLLALLKAGDFPKETYYKLGNLYLKQKDYKAAMKYYKKSIEQFPAYLTPYYQFSKVSISYKVEIPQAITYLDHFIQVPTEDKFPKLHWAYLRQGQLFELERNEAKAREAYRIALKYKPDFDQAAEAQETLGE